jgi:ribonuclease BN (tRNA processing enzyme)
VIPALTVALVALIAALPARAGDCAREGVALQVLGSGGPELQTRRASTSYLVWIDGKARVLVDSGGGAALRFGESGAQATDLDVVVFTHLHIDHTTDFPAIVKSAWFENRARALPIYGPAGNRFAPSAVTFVRELFDPTRGAYRYLGALLSPMARDGFRLDPHDVREKPAKLGVQRREADEVIEVFSNEQLRIAAVTVTHGQVPALAFRVEAGGKRIVLSGDTTGAEARLAKLARDADLLVAHNAVTETANSAERALHMPPSVIGELALAAQAKQLVLSHRMLRTLGQEDDTLAQIRKRYSGPVTFANDLDCFAP